MLHRSTRQKYGEGIVEIHPGAPADKEPVEVMY
jgi:hypothetical protein